GSNLLKHCRNRRRRIAFEAVVDDHEQFSPFGAGPPRELAQSPTALRVGVSYSLVRLELSHGLLVAPPGPQQRPADQEVGGMRLIQDELVSKRRHLSPAVEDMRRSMFAKALEVGRIQVVRVTQF